MNVEETIALIEALKAAGAVRFKSRDFEIELRRGKVAKLARVAPPAQAAEQAYNADATKRAEDLMDILKRRDEQVMDLVFPEGAGG